MNTREYLLDLARAFKADHKELTNEKLMSLYKDDQDRVIAYIYVQYSNRFKRYLNGFKQLDYELKESIILRAIWVSLDRGSQDNDTANLITYAASVAEKEMKSKLRELGFDKRKANLETWRTNESYEVIVKDFGFNMIDVLDRLESMNLCSTGRRICDLLLTSPHVLGIREMSRYLKIDKSKVIRTLRKLRPIFEAEGWVLEGVNENKNVLRYSFKTELN